MLAELAERRGVEEGALLTELIKREAIAEFCAVDPPPERKVT
jgi:hypothetical protein